MREHRMERIASMFALLLATGCSSDTQNLNEKVSVENANPTGSVGGVVYDGLTQNPISSDAAEVHVTILAGGQKLTATADEDGFFSISDVPASGPVQVLIEADGYLSAHMSAEFVNEAGEFPVDNASISLGPIGLIPATGHFTLHLYNDSGAPVAEAPLVLSTRLRWLLWDNGQPRSQGTVTTAPVTTGADGSVRFDGLPDYWTLGSAVDDTLVLTVPPLDYDGDGVFDFPGNEYTFTALHTNGPDQTLVLSSGYPQSLRILSSNVPALETSSALTVPSVIAPDATIRVVFSLPIDEATLLVRVVDEQGENSIETDTTVSGRTLGISFPTPLPTGSGFHLQIHATSSVTNHPVSGNFYAPLFTASTEPPRVTDLDVDPDADPSLVNPTLLVYFNQPVGPGNPSRITYTGSSCVVWFNYDTNGTGQIGDVAPEVGYSTCNRAGISFSSAEILVNMPSARLSGFSSVWRIAFPQDPQLNVPTGGQMQLLFSGVTDQTRVFSTPDGQVVPDQLAVPIP